MNIAEEFVRCAQQDPNRSALVIADEPARRWSYGELYAGAAAVARALRIEFGATTAAGTRVGVLLNTHREFLEVFYGAALAGVPAMVLDTAWSERELDRVLADTPPAWLFCDESTRALVGSRDRWDTIVVGNDYDDLLARYGGRTPAGDGAAGVFPEVSDDAPFYVAFTSGSTGRPKGAVRTHRSWLHTFERSEEEFGIGGDDHILLPGSLSHSHFLYGAVHGLHVGATIYLIPRFSATRVRTCLDQYPITQLYVVPTMFAMLLEELEPKRTYPRLRTILSVGAQWSPSSRSRAAGAFPNADPVECYGATELSFVSVLHGRDGGPLTSVGRPFRGVRLSLRAPDGSEVSTGSLGRIHVHSDMLFSGYLSADDIGSPWDDDGWFTVGDVGRLDEQGYLYLVGRDRGMLISGGVNVYPEEVEAALLEIDETAEAAVVGLPDDKWGELVCAIVRWRDGARLSLAELQNRCMACLSRQKCPRRVFEIERFPYTSGGKIARQELRAALRAGQPTLREVL